MYSKDLGNGNALYFNKIYSTDSDDVIICLEDTSDYYEIKNDIQFHKLTARYVGYDDTVSEDFANEIGSNITVFSSERDRFIIESAISNYKFTVLGCNSDYTKCDIAYSNYEDNNIEIHSIDIIYDENVSDYFKKIININDDDTIDIYVDEGIDTISNYYFSTYDEKSGDYLNYSCNYTNCLINYQNDFSRKRETHRVNYNLIESEPSQYYLDKVKLSTNIYLGENNYTIKQLELTPYFKINNDDYGINNHGCNNTTKKCIISLLSVNHNVELHYGSVVLKDGISDRFKSLIPDNKIKLNAVYHNDSEYLYGVSRVFFDRAKDWVYMDTYNETTKKGVVAYDIEKHSVDVEFVKGDTDKQKIIDDTITLFGQIEKKINLYDMDFVNHVYYNEGRSRYVNINFNSKQLYDYFKSVVDNKHITYYYAPYGGGGDVFCEGNVGQLILFYDGVAYGVANNPISTWVQNIIFVPDETEDTTDAYIEAALKRINKYFGKDVGMNIEFNQMMPEETSQFEYYGINNFDGKVYTLSYKGFEYNIAIVKDTSKITNSSFTAFDINNNVIITSDNVNYPTDTVVQSDIIDENSEAYKAILKKLNIKHAKIIDINLYSYIIGLIKEFKNNTFNVSLPIDTNEFDINNLYAYYIDDKGNLEEHKVTIDDFMASFETTHFSTYIITEKIDDANKNDIKDVKKIIDENINNSNTGDTINYSFISLGVSSLILIVSTILIVLLKKKKVHR